MHKLKEKLEALGFCLTEEVDVVEEDIVVDGVCVAERTLIGSIITEAGDAKNFLRTAPTHFTRI